MSTSHGTRLRGRTWYRRVVLGIVALVVLAKAAFGPFGGGVAHAADPSPLPINGQGTKPVAFQGGWIQTDPIVYLVFWGPKWNTDMNHIAVKTQVEDTFKALAGSRYNEILTQYGNPGDTSSTSSNNFVHNDVTLRGSIIDSSTPPSALVDIGVEAGPVVFAAAQIRGEATYALSTLFPAHGVQPTITSNTQVIVFPQQGVGYTIYQACGMHSYNSSSFSQPFTYAYIRYTDQGSTCDSVPDDNGTYNTATSIARSAGFEAVHEYAEAATDPNIFFSLNPLNAATDINGSGWNTHERLSNQYTPYEIADLCENYTPLSNPTLFPDYTDNNGTQYDLPYLWSNQDNGCVASEPDFGPQLFGLSPDRQGVYALSLEDAAGVTRGPVSWTQVGGPAAHIYGGGYSIGSAPGGLAATNPQTGNIYAYTLQTGSWTQIGGPGTDFVSSGLMLYGQSSAGIFQYSGQGLNWTQIGGPAGKIYPGGGSFDILATDIYTGNIYGYESGVWTQIGGPGLNFVANQAGVGGIYGQSSAGIFQYSGQGMNWTQIGGPAGQMYAGGTYFSVLATDIHTGGNPATGSHAKLMKNVCS